MDLLENTIFEQTKEINKLKDQNIVLKDRLGAVEVVSRGSSAFNPESEHQDDVSGNYAEVRTKRDTSSNPNAAYYEQQQQHQHNHQKDANYAAYYEQYPEQYQLNNNQPQDSNEKLGFGVSNNDVD